MLKNVDIEKLADKIKESPNKMIQIFADDKAKYLVAEMDEILEPAVLAWIEGREVPNISYGEYSISKIMAYRNTTYYLMGMEYLSDYIKDPERGKERIHMPNYSSFPVEALELN